MGKSMPGEGHGPNKRFGYVSCYDTKPKRRLFDLLQSQGMQFNQQVTFLSHGGDTVRDLQLYISPQGEYLLDWFHVAMRLTVLAQFVKGLPTAKPKLPAKTVAKWKRAKVEEAYDEAEMDYPAPEEITKKLERVKWYLWHGNAYQALQIIDELEFDLEPMEGNDVAMNKLYGKIQEFKGYITSNQQYIVNYGDRYRNEETISSSFVESTVNEVISKRFVKKQQMRWTKAGAHQLLQVRIQVLNEEWRASFCRWYPPDAAGGRKPKRARSGGLTRSGPRKNMLSSLRQGVLVLVSKAACWVSTVSIWADDTPFSRAWLTNVRLTNA